MAKFIATIVMVATVEVETDRELNRWDIENNLRWSAEQGYLDLQSEFLDRYLRADSAVATVVEVE